MNREEMIGWLIDNDLDGCDREYLSTILRMGWLGYDKLSDWDLREEIFERSAFCAPETLKGPVLKVIEEHK